MAIALIHDWLNQLGGAEDVLVELHTMFPDAPVYTSIYDRARMPAEWRAWDIRSSWMDRLPRVHRMHQPYMPLFAATFAAMRIPDQYDLVLSNKSAFCIGVRIGARTRHVCYCLTPTRFTFDFYAYAKREHIPAPAKAILPALNAVLRAWERRAARRVTRFIAISREVQQRIQTCYGRDSIIIYPPVRVNRYAVSYVSNDYFLIVSRLLPYKRIDLAIEACNRLGLPLWIAGDGRDRPRLERMAGPTVRLLGRVDDSTLSGLLAGCRAFIFPGLEDFGIAPIQAMACGKPVIAYAGGGALDTVIEGVTGLLFREPTPDSLAIALSTFQHIPFDPAGIRLHAEKFSAERFQKEIMQVLRQHGAGRPA